MSTDEIQFTEPFYHGAGFEYRKSGYKNDPKARLLVNEIKADESSPTYLNQQANHFKKLGHLDAFPKSYGVKKVENEDCLILECPDGVPFIDYLAKHKLSITQSLQLALSLCRMTQEVHNNGYLIVQLNPAFLLYNSFDDRFSFVNTHFFHPTRLLETGISSPWSINHYYKEIHYLSPELCHPQPHTIDYRSDLFQIGSILYECLTGNKPFPAQSSHKQVLALLESEPPRPGSLIVNLGQATEKIVLRLLAKNPAERYQDINYLIRDLQTCLDQHSQKENRQIELSSHGNPLIINTNSRPFIEPHIYNKILDAHKKSILGVRLHTHLWGESDIINSAYAQSIQLQVLKNDGLYLFASHDQCDTTIPYFIFIKLLEYWVGYLEAGPVDEYNREKERFAAELYTDFSLLGQLSPILARFFGPCHAQLKITQLDSAPPREFLQSIFIQAFALLATRKRPLTVVLENIENMDDDSMILLQSILNETSLEYFHLISCSLKSYDSCFGNMELKQNQFAQKKINIAPLTQKQMEAWVKEVIGSQTSGLETLLSFIWNKAKSDLGMAQILIMALINNKMIASNAHQRSHEFELDNFKASLIPQESRQIAFSFLGDLEATKKEIIFTLAWLTHPVSAQQLHHFLYEDISLEKVTDALTELVNLSYVQCNLSRGLLVFAINNAALAMGARLLFNELDKAQRLYKLASQISDESTNISRLHTAGLLSSCENLIRNQNDRTRIISTIRALEKVALLLLLWHDISRARKLCLFLQHLNADDTLFDELFMINALAYYIDNSTQANDETSTNQAAQLATRKDSQRLVLHYINTLQLIAIDETQALRSCKTILRISGIRLGLFSKMTGQFFWNRRKIQTMLNRPVHQRRHDPQDEIILSSMLIYANLLQKTKQDHYLAVLAKALELALRLQNDNHYIPLIISKIAICFSYNNNFLHMLWDFIHTKYSTDAGVHAIVFRNFYDMDQNYAAWQMGFPGHIQNLNQRQMTGAAAVMIVDWKILDFFNQDRPLGEWRQSTADKIKKLHDCGYLDQANLLGQLHKGASIMSGSHDSKSSPAIANANSHFYSNLIQLGLSLHLGEYNSSSMTNKQLGIARQADAPVYLQNILNFYAALYHISQYHSAPKKEKLEIKKLLALAMNRLQNHFEHHPDAQPHRFLFIQKLLGNLSLQHNTTTFEELDRIIELARHNKSKLEAALMSRIVGLMYLEQGSESLARNYFQSAFDLYKQVQANGICIQLKKLYPEWIQHPISIPREVEPEPPASIALPSDKIHQFYQKLHHLNEKEVFKHILDHSMGITQASRAGLFWATQQGDLELKMMADRQKQAIKWNEQPKPEDGRLFPQSILDSSIRSKQDIMIWNFDTDAGLFREDPYFAKVHVKSVLCICLVSHDYPVGLLYLDNHTAIFNNAMTTSLDWDFEHKAYAQSLYNLNKKIDAKQEIGHLNSLVQKSIQLYKQSLQEQALLKKQIADLSYKNSTFLTELSNIIQKPLYQLEKTATSITVDNAENNKPELISQIENFKDVISKILRFSEQKFNQPETEPDVFYLNECIQKVILDYAKKAAEKNIEIIYEASNRLPLRIIGDESHLSQVLDNLLNNAIKYTPSGIIHIQVEARQLDVLHEISFQITDSGIGIQPDQLSTLFMDPWDFANDLTNATRGLGLVIAKRLCQIMGGDIRIESEYGKGTTAGFFIKGLAVQTRIEPIQNSEILNGKKILLVDDILANRRIIRHKLRRWGSFPMAAISGKAAIELVSNGDKRFSLAIIDHDMPNMDGLELAKILRNNQITQHIIIILMINPMSSADDFKEHAHLIQDFIHKPVALDKLHKKIINLLLDAKARYAHEKKDSIADSLDMQRFD